MPSKKDGEPFRDAPPPVPRRRNPEEDRLGTARNKSAEGANTNSIAATGDEGGAGDEPQRA